MNNTNLVNSFFTQLQTLTTQLDKRSPEYDFFSQVLASATREAITYKDRVFNPLFLVPFDKIYKVMTHLGLVDIISFSSTCRTFRNSIYQSNTLTSLFNDMKIEKMNLSAEQTTRFLASTPQLQNCRLDFTQTSLSVIELLRLKQLRFEGKILLSEKNLFLNPATEFKGGRAIHELCLKNQNDQGASGIEIGIFLKLAHALDIEFIDLIETDRELSPSYREGPHFMQNKRELILGLIKVICLHPKNPEKAVHELEKLIAENESSKLHTILKGFLKGLQNSFTEAHTLLAPQLNHQNNGECYIAASLYLYLCRLSGYQMPCTEDTLTDIYRSAAWFYRSHCAHQFSSASDPRLKTYYNLFADSSSAFDEIREASHKFNFNIAFEIY